MGTARHRQRRRRRGGRRTMQRGRGPITDALKALLIDQVKKQGPKALKKYGPRVGRALLRTPLVKRIRRTLGVGGRGLRRAGTGPGSRRPRLGLQRGRLMTTVF